MDGLWNREDVFAQLPKDLKERWAEAQAEIGAG